MSKKDDEVTSVRMEYGLKLPNREIVWNEYRGIPIQTPQQRWALWQILRKTAEDVGFTEEDFLPRYGWVSRSVTTSIKNQTDWAIDNNQICIPPTEDTDSANS